MAKMGGLSGGMLPSSVREMRETKRKAAPPRTGDAVCSCCGYQFTGTVAQRKKRFVTEYNDDLICIGCYQFFETGYTNISPTHTKRRLEEIELAGWVTILKTGNYCGAKSGINFTVEFGDIFKVSRVGASEEPDGTPEGSFRRFTIDITVGPETLTLYPHEAGSVTWTEIMFLRSDGEIQEAFLCQEDNTGYFTPTPEFKQQLIEAFGHR